MSKRRITPGFTKQGVRDLSYIKSPPPKRFELPPSMGLNCDHPHSAIREDSLSGCTSCTNCHQMWDFDGRPF